MSQAVGPLGDEEDAFGRLLLDYLDGRAGDAFLDRDDGETGPAMGPEWFFAEPEAVAGSRTSRVRRRARPRARRRRRSRPAQPRGAASRAGRGGDRCVAGSGRRSVAAAGSMMSGCSRWPRVDDDLGVFDTVLMMCGNFGLVGNAEEACDDSPPAARDDFLARENRPRLGRPLRRFRRCGPRVSGAKPRARAHAGPGDDPHPLPGTCDPLVRPPERLRRRARPARGRNGLAARAGRRRRQGDPPDYYAVLEKA